MKKYRVLLVLPILLIGVVLLGGVVKAEVIPIDGDTPTDSSILGTDSEDLSSDTSATAETKQDSAGVPDTGFAPTQNKVLASAFVFAVGASLGTAVGLGVVKYRRDSKI